MKKILCFAIFTLTLLITACQKESSMKAEKCLHLNFNVDPLTLDPRKSGDFVSSAAIFMLYSGLTQFQPDNAIGPGIAEAYDISNDGKIYTFHLRDTKWSDGEPIVAADFEKAWKKLLSPDFPALCKQLLYPIKNAEKIAKGEADLATLGVKAIDPKTLVVELINPTPYFLTLTSFSALFPIPSHVEEKDPKWAYREDSSFVSNGPFKLIKWRHSNEMILAKNPNYWGTDSVLVDSVKISMISNENTALQMFEKGGIDTLGAPFSPLPIDSIPALLKRYKVEIQPIGGTTFCAFNVNAPPFNNKNIRKAFSLAINRTPIVINITQLKEMIATRYFPPVLMNNKERKIVENNNQKMAQELLEKGLNELGIDKKDLQITLSFSSSILPQKIAEALQEQWQTSLGVKVKLDRVEEKIWQEKIHKHDFQTAIAHWIVQYDDAQNILDRFKYKDQPKNYPGWENQDYIKLLNKITVTNNLEERLSLIEKAEDLLADEMPLTPLYHHNYAILVNPRVKGMFVGRVADIHFDRVKIEEN